MLTKAFAPKTIVRTTYVLAGDMLRFLLCAFVLAMNSSWSIVRHQWSPLTTLVGAGIPAALYAIQSYCSLMAYQHLSPIDYNVLNQTKTLSAAVFCYFLLAKPQSKLQILSLFVLLGSALVIEKVIPIRKKTVATNLENRAQETEFIMGVAPILLASLISGLAGAICQ
jgi:UDP-sugar transporter A1/2/3